MQYTVSMEAANDLEAVIAMRRTGWTVTAKLESYDRFTVTARRGSTEYACSATNLVDAAELTFAETILHTDVAFSATGGVA